MLRARLGWLKHLGLALVALLLLLCAAEVGVRLFLGTRLAEDGADFHFVSGRLGASPHSAATLGVAAARDGALSDESRLFVPSRLVHHQLRPLQTLVQHNPDGAAIPLAINSFGLRGPEPLVPKPPGVFRILCLGDEAVLGAGIRAERAFCQQLQSSLQSQTRIEIEVINAGVPGYCPLLSLLQMRRQLTALQPDCVVLTVSPNDVTDDRRYRRFTEMDRNNVPLACGHPSLLQAAAADRSHWWEQLALVDLGRQSLDRYLRQKYDADDVWNEPPDPAAIRQAVSPVVSLRDLCRSFQAECVVGLLPSDETLRQSLYELSVKQRIPFCDATEVVQFGEGRLSETGHALYAGYLQQFLLRHVAGPWSSPYFRAATR